MTARDIASGEQDAMLTKGVTNTDDLRERQAKLLKMRSLMFQHEIKAKRLKKIKSKEYRRKLKKEDSTMRVVAVDPKARLLCVKSYPPSIQQAALA